MRGCSTPGGTLTAKLLLDGSIIATATQYVAVEAPVAEGPAIEIAGLATAFDQGQSDTFTVTASGLNASHQYVVRVGYSNKLSTTSDCLTTDPITRNIGGSGTLDTFTGSFTVYGCAAGTATITAALHRAIHGVEQTDPIATADPVTTIVTPPPTIEADLQSVFTGQTVTLTASTQAARGTPTAYKWQRFSSGSWVDIGTTTANSKTVSSDQEGLKAFRAIVLYREGQQSETGYVLLSWRPVTVSLTVSDDLPGRQQQRATHGECGRAHRRDVPVGGAVCRRKLDRPDRLCGDQGCVA